jgi:hypothetical protein
LHEEEFNDFYSSSNIVTVIKYRRVKWAGHKGGRELLLAGLCLKV